MRLAPAASIVVFGFLTIVISTATLLIKPANIARADEAADLQSKIDQRASDIRALEMEIEGYQKQLNSLAEEKDSLNSAIQALNINEKKLRADIAITKEKIDATNLKIRQLSSDIGVAEEGISDNAQAILASFQAINEEGDQSLLGILLSSRSIGDALDGITKLSVFEVGIRDRTAQLSAAKASLEGTKRSTEAARAELVKLQNQIDDQRKIVSANQAEKAALLKSTQNSETAYARLLAEKQAQKEAFEKEVLQYESDLRLVVDKGLLPNPGSSVLKWPLDKIFVTQYFGNTPFATANAQIYRGAGHTGVDFRASVGTPVRASLTGTVIGVENTDSIRGCYSFGKWVMIRHPNGLSTLYSHLSVQSVTVGQTVATGQVIGYSGNTGASTGPHLHFGVYATDGVEIAKFTQAQSKNCAGATIPVAVLSAYLNPLSYLPKI